MMSLAETISPAVPPKVRQIGAVTLNEWPEHVGRACSAIRERRRYGSGVRTREGVWFTDEPPLERHKQDKPARWGWGR